MIHYFVLAAAIPNPGPVAPPGLADITNTLLGWLKWGLLVAGVGGILICAGMIILGRRNRNQMATDGVLGSVWVLGGLALASAAGVLVGAVM
ncbi:MAG: hypothetical protein JWQ60_2136 [Pseudonocardia sp.]|jgi:hypothetical protein|nr:hypothetical protein [Pseudonocardia sp.]